MDDRPLVLTDSYTVSDIDDVKEFIFKHKINLPKDPDFIIPEVSSNPTLMVDWITFKVPFLYAGNLNGGNIFRTSRSGELEYKVNLRLGVKGSFDDKLSIRTEDVSSSGNTSLISISGNPVKWFQGHNIFGSDDLNGLVYETVLAISEILESQQPSFILKGIFEGGYSVSRVDINGMYYLKNRNEVLSWLTAAERTGRSRHGTALSKGNTVYFGKNSQRWSIKCYSKGQEIEKHKLPRDLHLDSLKDFADNKLRIELTLRQKELKKLDLINGSSWVDIDLWALYKEYAERIEMTAQRLEDYKLLDIPKFAKSSYIAWSAGHNPRDFVSKSKFYKDRKALLDFGVDISILKPKEQVTDNVVPLRRVLELKPTGIPDWAYGTKLLFEPRKSAK